MSPQHSAIRVEQISKSFGKLQALKSVSFEIPKETVFCILGPNGAGKTTLLRILTTVSRPSAGDAFIDDVSILSHALAVRQRIGIVAQDNHFDRYLSVWHNLTLHAQMHGMARPVYERRIQELLEKVELYDRRASFPDELSGGMQRRIALIRALIHHPTVLFLDEPTTGLDPQARIEIWKTIEQFKRSATVILTTHYMEEADRLSDSILMLHHGRVVTSGTSQSLKSALSPNNRYEMLFKEPKANAYIQKLNAFIVQANLTEQVSDVQVLDDQRIGFHVYDPEIMKPLLEQVHMADLLQFGPAQADLEDVFLSIATSPQDNEENAS